MPHATSPTTNSTAPLTRRQFTGGVLAAGAICMSQSLSTNAGQAADDSQGQWIDAHSHIWTRDVKAFPLAKSQTVDDLKPASFTDDELMKIARPHGVARAVLIQHHIYHGWDNAYLLDAARRHPDRFRVVAMVDDTKPHPDVEMRRLLPLKVTGFRITPRIRGDQWLDGPGMAAMWKCAAETGQALCCLIDPQHLAGVAKMSEMFPDTNVVIDHFARIGGDGELRDSDIQRLCDLAKRPRVRVKVSAFYALGKKRAPYLDLVPMIRRLFDSYGASRLMWASDCPYQVVEGHNYADSIALVRDKLDFVSAEDRQWLLCKTAEQAYLFDRS